MQARSSLTPVAALIALALGCASGDQSATGARSVDLSLTILGQDIDRVSFEISGPALPMAVAGEFYVDDDRDPPVWATVMNLPVGEGYVVTLVAYDDMGEVLCSGSQSFEVLEDETVKVDVVLVCETSGEDPLGNVDIDATFDINYCPRIHFVGATPSCIPAGETASVQVVASDNDDDPLQVQWTATAGSFADPNSDSTEFSCDGAAGVQTLTATVVDGQAICTKSKSVDVECNCGGTVVVNPRTPGYWSNWNRCTGGNQAQTADNNGGAANGFHLVEDVIPQTVGLLEVNTCELAVSVLTSLDVVTDEERDNDGAYRLARNLLAALFNFEAGAGSCPQADMAAADGQQLLLAIGFNGTGAYLPPGPGSEPDRSTALALAETLDDYNNGNLCN